VEVYFLVFVLAELPFLPLFLREGLSYFTSALRELALEAEVFFLPWLPLFFADVLFLLVVLFAKILIFLSFRDIFVKRAFPLFRLGA
jgi:hypothetical protein